jgi:signal transduction histidine kinase
MGMITYKMHDYQLAAKYFKESAHLSTLVDDEFAYFYRLQEVYDNIALSFKHNNQPDSAIVYFNKAISFINQNTPKFKDRTKMIDMALGVVYGNKAEVLTLKGDYAEATGLLKKSIAINLQPGYDNNDAALAEIKLAQIYFDRHQSDALVKLLRDMRLQFDTIKNQAAEADWNRLMSDYSLEKNDPAKALNYLRTYNILKDSVMAKVNLLRESNVNEQLENFEKQYQIDSLKDNNNLQKRYLYAAIVCAILSLIIIFLVLRNWIRSKNDIRIVNALNKQVNSQKASLEKTLADLKASDLEKDRILRTVAHDLRNPIGGIAALTRTMADDNYTEEQLEFINLIKETSQNSLALINEILEVTNNGSVKLIKEPSDINALLSNSVELLNFKAAEKDQHIILTPTEAPLIINISREKIWRVVSNLISNALKFSPQKAIVNVKVIDLGKMIQITVTDTGMGIPDDLKTKVFNMFTEAKRPGTDGEKSFGLGLSISKQIIEDHRGKLWFESDGKTGTTFFVNLPKK